MPGSCSITILGRCYDIEKKKYEDEPIFEKDGIDGYHDGYSRKIVFCDMKSNPKWKDEAEKTIEEAEKLVLRHEIVRAFLFESGLDSSSMAPPCAWARNEETVDWIALQGIKIMYAWGEAGAI